MPYDEARRIMGPDATVGVTCKNSRHLAIDLGEAGADFIAVSRGVWDYPQGPAAAVRDFNAVFAKNSA